MALLPSRLRPTTYLRRRAKRYGWFARSTIWRYLALYFTIEKQLKRFIGKSPDDLGTRRVEIGQVLTVATHAPLGRKQRRKTGVSKATLEAAARAELEAAQRAS